MIAGIWAEDAQGLIGVNGTLPWSLPAELRHFKATTMGQAILMGRKTFDGMNQRTLPGRTTIVMTRDKSYTVADKSVLIFHEPQAVLAWYAAQSRDSAKDLYIIGGAEMFQVFSQSLDRLYRTIVSGVFEGDTYFPDVIQFDHFSELSSTTHPEDPENKYGFTVKTYEKNK